MKENYEVMFTDELYSLLKKSVEFKKKYFVIRQDQNEDKHRFWLSGNRNVTADIFSAKDILTKWNVLEVASDS